VTDTEKQERIRRQIEIGIQIMHENDELMCRLAQGPSAQESKSTMTIEGRIISLLTAKLAQVMTAPEIDDDGQIVGANGFVYGESREMNPNPIEIRLSWTNDAEGEETEPLLHWRKLDTDGWLAV
jgi:hypothetical protein